VAVLLPVRVLPDIYFFYIDYHVVLSVLSDIHFFHIDVHIVHPVIVHYHLPLLVDDYLSLAVAAVVVLPRVGIVHSYSPGSWCRICLTK